MKKLKELIGCSWVEFFAILFAGGYLLIRMVIIGLIFGC